MLFQGEGEARVVMLRAEAQAKAINTIAEALRGKDTNKII